MDVRRIGAAAAATLLALTITAPGASASDDVTAENYGGAARGRLVDVTVRGEGITLGAGVAGAEVDPLNDDISVSAAGVGATIEPATIVAAGAMGQSDEGCAVPQLAELFGALHLDAGLACGEASIEGAGTDFTAVGSGSLAELRISTGSVIAALLDLPELGDLAGTTFGAVEEIEQAVDEEADPVLAEQVELLNDTLDRVLRTGDVVPALDVSDTLRDLIERLTTTKLVDVRLGAARGEIVSDADGMTSRAVDEGAVVTVLPGFMPDGTPLATITVEASTAEVSYQRSDASAEGRSQSATVRVDSPLGDMSETVEVGESVRLFCGDAVDAGSVSTDLPLDLPTAPLCTEISVGEPSERQVNGRLQVESALVDIHVAKGLGELLGLRSVRELPLLGEMAAAVGGEAVDTVNGVLEELGLVDDGVVTASGSQGDGVRLTLAGATAEGGGVKVLGDVRAADERPFEGALPRTGGAGMLPIAATALLGMGVGLRALVGRNLGSDIPRT